MNKKHKIGIIGGTFNPIHYGHLMIADNARQQFDLEKVYFMPTGHTPHKAFMGEDMSKHRCRMTEMAISDNPWFDISYREIKSDSVNYTYLTLHELNEAYPDTQFYFILGADSLFDFDIWRHPELICQEAIILAAVRDNHDDADLDRQISYIKEKYHGNVYRIVTPGFSISSNNIRQRINAGTSIRYMLPDQVLEYIRDHQLYV